MAYMQISLRSQALQRTVNVNVILPVEDLAVQGPVQPLRTLYLLHGYNGSQNDWVHRTRILALAEAQHLAVVMPAGENGFYVDEPARNNLFGRFIGHELVQLTRAMFPLSRRREDTYLAGLSMGGYGALRNGLQYHETFGALASLSGALDIRPPYADEGVGIFRRTYLARMFGDLDTLEQSDHDLCHLVERLVGEGVRLPAIYLAGGLQDSLLPHTQRFAQKLLACQVPFTYEEARGAHDFVFWDTYIERALAFFSAC